MHLLYTFLDDFTIQKIRQSATASIVHILCIMPAREEQRPSTSVTNTKRVVVVVTDDGERRYCNERGQKAVDAECLDRNGTLSAFCVKDVKSYG